MRVPKTLAVVFFSWFILLGTAVAQEYDDDEGEPAVTVGGKLQLQGGVFVPLFTDGFKPLKNEAYRKTSETAWEEDDDGNRIPCDPRTLPYYEAPYGCTAARHGKQAGSLSMARATLQLEGDWLAHEDVNLHVLMRAIRSAKLDADKWAQLPKVRKTELQEELRLQDSVDFVHENYYSEFELREIYVDAYPYDWLSLRMGRQQIAWGELGQLRLLDVINPVDTTWHLGSLESFEDTRIPLWMVQGMIDMPSIDHALELVWAPLFFDNPEDTVNVPLTFVGAWGLPWTNTPPTKFIEEKVFLYPGGRPEDMRGGVRWKGNLGTSFTYSLAYYYTHLVSPPIVMRYFYPRQYNQTTRRAKVGSNYIERLELEFPRQHIAGLSMEYAFDNPIGMVAKLEAAVEPDRTFPTKGGLDYSEAVPNEDADIIGDYEFKFSPQKETAVSYAIQLWRPTMIRFLNPTQNFLIIGQFMHIMVPTLSDADKELLIDIPGYNETGTKTHTFVFVLTARTYYMNGLLQPIVLFAYLPPGNGLYTAVANFRFGEHWRMSLRVSEFFGKDPYKSVGLFEDRDEVNLTLACLF